MLRAAFASLRSLPELRLFGSGLMRWQSDAPEPAKHAAAGAAAARSVPHDKLSKLQTRP